MVKEMVAARVVEENMWQTLEHACVGLSIH